MRLLLLPLLFSVAFAVDMEFVPGLGYYWVPKIFNNISVQYRWDESMSSCVYEGGHLAVINSQEEAEVLAKLLERDADTPYGHVGFSDLFVEGHYMTVNDEPLSAAGYSAWASGYPNGGATSNCGAINRKGELMDISCYSIQTPLCEAEIWKGYDLVEGMGYYKFYEEQVTWGHALQLCQQESSSLAVINSDEEAKVVAALFEGHAGANLAHVGVQDEYREAFYFTVHGQKIEESGYNKWTAQQPVKNRYINYVGVDNEGLYHMVNGTELLPFICEHAL